MIQPPLRQSLSEFQRDTKASIARLERTGYAVALTVQGRPRIVVQDADAYQRILELAMRAETMDAIREGIADAKTGRTIPAAEATRRLKARSRSRRRG